MKTAVIVLAFFVAFAAAEDDDEGYLITILRPEFEACKASMNPSKETLKFITDGEGDDNKDVQCFKACMWKKAGVMSDAKLDMDKLESVFLMDKEVDKAEVKEAMTIIKNCKAKAEVSNNECEVIAAYTKCTESEI